MAKKQKKPEIRRPPTKRQLSKWQRQRRLQRIITIAGSVFLAFIVVYAGYGYYNDQIKPLNQPVVRVNDTVFDMDYYLKALDVYSQGQDATTVAIMADMTAQVLEQNELVRQGAADLGLGVSTEEIDSALDNLDLPNDEVYRDAISAELLTDKLLGDYFDPKVPTACEQAQVQAMFLESREVAEEVIDRLEASDNFTSLAKAFSAEPMTKETGGDLGWLPKGFFNVLLGNLGNSLLEETAFDLEPGTLSEPTYDGSFTKGIGYWLIEVVERDEDKGTHAKGILLGSQQEAEEIGAKLEGGEDFAALAREYSQHSESKELEGDLGWFQKGIGDDVVSRIAIQLEPGIVSRPVADESAQTLGGYWLVKVVDKDANRQLEDEVREELKSRAFEGWLSQQREKSAVENYLDEEQKSWAIARVVRDREE